MEKDKYEKLLANLEEGKNMSIDLMKTTDMSEETIAEMEKIFSEIYQIGVNAINLRKQIEASNKKNLICKNCDADGNCTCK